MADNDDEGPEYGPTYKALFLGACVIIGSTFGWWLTNFISAVDSLHASYERRIAELEARSIELGFKQARVQQDVETNTRVLRELERESVRRQRP